MMMSRPVVLVFLLVILIITSQFEWKQQLANEIEASPIISQKQQQISNREEIIKEKIILSQEKNIQRLNELVQSLQLQLLQCRGSNNTINDTGSSFTANGNEIENKHMLED
ncbi:uncharacterized protein LOC103971253 [Musa acuminata AAA Group]|uniref:Uncharacterized protein n=3 Tax=Musa TaxID=4640 RepID=A0A4S8J2Y7_MUSBA|nr:PREDICTED: uncharacterized protein LOC103971253 [Musa acuminata subsp. malaccensis]THU55730.1 hypothetical protein C4D60_Mb11t09640 [Musa balbisiana]URD78595.1 hypothetical protein MUK42_02441 [Musa troglodytarum]CAG1864112.1 unnamed protein product [Musa acuminata subsp. malaccensis]